ncbi:unnamed protein product [Bursaphelenchus okinawaensis]|uniref:Uncharacterized protein n=1 Tax=Bursaphelenchus okinawaensis TaxID=465554 RepID=A0A811KDC2_9BILA|nr:unnamed protein product [Bursaphelenchus okinawaensis]CAG9097993.1 unnamed protein product [Bursaphelenchus okinawaensis]
MALGDYSFGANFLDSLKENRINEAHINKLMFNIQKLCDKWKLCDKPLEEVDGGYYIHYADWRKIYENMPKVFKQTCPITIIPSMGCSTHEIRRLLTEHCQLYNGIESLGFRNGDKYEGKFDIDELMAFIEKEYVKKMPQYDQAVEESANLMPEYMRMLKTYLGFLLPSSSNITVANVVETGVLSALANSQTSPNWEMERYDWTSIGQIVHLRLYFDFLSRGNSLISKENFKICRHYRDYQGDSKYFSFDWTHQRTFTDAFIDRLFEVMQGKGMITSEGMNFDAFLKFQIMLDYRTAKKTLQFCFDIFDRYAKGYIAPCDIKYFFNSYKTAYPNEEMPEDFPVCLPKDFVHTEIMMAKMARAGDNITFDDIWECAKSHSSGNFVDLMIHQLASPDGYLLNERRVDGSSSQDRADDTVAPEEPEAETSIPPPTEEYDFLIGEPKALDINVST